MSWPVYITLGPLTGADDNGIATTQSPGAAGNLTLTASPVVLDVPRRVSITSDGNDTGVTFTIYGNQRVDGTGNAISETITGPSGGAVESVLNYGQVSRISISAAATGNIIVGTDGVASTPPQMVNYEAQPVGLTIAVVVTGTVNYTVQYSYDEIMGLPNPSSWSPTVPAPVWFNDPVLVSVSATGETTFNDPIQAWRVTLNSGSGSLAIKMIQSGIRG